MTEYEKIYNDILKVDIQDIPLLINTIPDIHKKEVLNELVERVITLAESPSAIKVAALCKLGADPNGTDDNKGYPLNFAYITNLYPIVDTLLAFGANPNETYSNVLNEAFDKKDAKYIVRFIESGAEFNKDDTTLLAKFSDHPDIQKYLLIKGLVDSDNLLDKLQQTPLLKLSEFTYHTVDTPIISNTPALYTQDYNTKYFIVKGNTKQHQDLLRKYAGRYINGIWYILNKYRENVDRDIEELLMNTEPSFIIQQVTSTETITLYTQFGTYGYLTTEFIQPNLLYIDGYSWDSVERYLMYKMYEGSNKADAIKKATTIEEARDKLQTMYVPIAKSPKQMVINQTLQPLAESKVNPFYSKNRINIFYKATKTKFLQHAMLRNKLLSTGSAQIINKNYADIFGYEGNLLGNTLMRIRAELRGETPNNDQLKTNSIVIEKYKPNEQYYVVRGDPDANLAKDIRFLGNYYSSGGKIIRGKLNMDLVGGPGWLIPKKNVSEMKRILAEYYPDDRKIEIVVKSWSKNITHHMLEIAIIFAMFRDHKDIDSDDLLFVLKDIYGFNDLLGENSSNPHYSFIKMVVKYCNGLKMEISDAAIKMLWNVLIQLFDNMIKDEYTFDKIEQTINESNDSLLSSNITAINGLTERESVIIHSYNKLYRLLRKIDENKACVAAAHMLVGSNHYAKIKQLYTDKTKLKSRSTATEEDEFRFRFKIKTDHLSNIIKSLPSTSSKKCKLLVLTMVDYIMELSGDEANKLNLKMLDIIKYNPPMSPSPKDPVKESPKNPVQEPTKNPVKEPTNM